MDNSASLYNRAGITDVASFYEDKFVYESVVELATGENCYNIDNLKDMWLLSNVRPGSRVLDFGCGSGRLGFLAKIGCELTGVDYSAHGVDWAVKINNYARGFAGTITDFVWPSGYFDYIVSMDVFGHIPFEEKDGIIASLKKLLKSGGVMLHGIECGNVDYDSLEPEELEQFVRVDGHVGIENKSRNYGRFRKFFRYVDGEVRFVISNSIREHQKRHCQYREQFDPDLAAYLENLDTCEKKAFDIASGLAQLELEKRNVASADEDSGFLFLRASDAELPPLCYRIAELNRDTARSGESASLENNRLFERGWFALEVDAGTGAKWRWGAPDALIKVPARFRNNQPKKVVLEMEAYGSPDAVGKISIMAGDCVGNFPVHGGTRQKINFVYATDAASLRLVSTLCGMPASDGNNTDFRLLGIKLYNFSMQIVEQGEFDRILAENEAYARQEGSGTHQEPQASGILKRIWHGFRRKML